MTSIAEGVIDGTGIFSGGFGKDRPTSGNWAQFNPKFSRPGGRFGGIVSGAYQIGKFLLKNNRKLTKAASAGIGYGAATSNRRGLRYASNYQYSKALRAKKQYRNRKRSRGQHNCCCCCS